MPVSYTHLDVYKRQFDNGAIYLLPSTYNCYGITYNKTLLKKYGWELPNSFAELEELAAKAKEAGVDLCLPQIQYPGYGFQYLCNIADADFLGTLDGRLWQRDVYKRQGFCRVAIQYALDGQRRFLHKFRRGVPVGKQEQLCAF